MRFWPMQKGPACGQQAGSGGHQRAPFAPVCPQWPTPTTRTPDLRLLRPPVPATCPQSRKMPSYREWQNFEARGTRRGFGPPQGSRTRPKASSMVYVKMGAIPISRFCVVHKKRCFWCKVGNNPKSDGNGPIGAAWEAPRAVNKMPQTRAVWGRSCLYLF